MTEENLYEFTDPFNTDQNLLSGSRFARDHSRLFSIRGFTSYSLGLPCARFAGTCLVRDTRQVARLGRRLRAGGSVAKAIYDQAKWAFLPVLAVFKPGMDMVYINGDLNFKSQQALYWSTK